MNQNQQKNPWTKFSGQNTFYCIRIDPKLLTLSAKNAKIAFNFLLDFSDDGTHGPDHQNLRKSGESD